jgi:hypothetical protein
VTDEQREAQLEELATLLGSKEAVDAYLNHEMPSYLREEDSEHSVDGFYQRLTVMAPGVLAVADGHDHFKKLLQFIPGMCIYVHLCKRL